MSLQTHTNIQASLVCTMKIHSAFIEVTKLRRRLYTKYYEYLLCRIVFTFIIPDVYLSPYSFKHRYSQVYTYTVSSSYIQSVVQSRNLMLHCVLHVPIASFILSPSHEVILAPLVLVPHRHLHLLALVGEQEQVELLQPTGIQGLEDRLRFEPFVAKSGMHERRRKTNIR